MNFDLVIFDMDGTLTEELLDFDAIRAEIGLPAGKPILEEITKLPTAGQQRAHEILDRHELSAAEASALHDGADALLAELRRRGVKVALLTRNSRRCASKVLTKHRLELDYVATREDTPHKPHPDSLLNVVRRFGVSRERTLMVGDYLYDLQAAAAAGVPSVLVCIRDGGKRPHFAGMATWCVAGLGEILAIVAGSPAAE